eukprot:Pgem_evm1s3280
MSDHSSSESPSLLEVHDSGSETESASEHDLEILTEESVYDAKDVDETHSQEIVTKSDDNQGVKDVNGVDDKREIVTEKDVLEKVTESDTINQKQNDGKDEDDKKEDDAQVKDSKGEEIDFDTEESLINSIDDDDDNDDDFLQDNNK